MQNLAQLPRLETLYLGHCNQASPDAITLSLQSFPSLRTLTLKQILLQAMVNICTLHPLFQHLVMPSIIWDGREYYDPPSAKATFAPMRFETWTLL
jgi:hypothetical protein